jgi:hypothetical protein
MVRAADRSWRRAAGPAHVLATPAPLVLTPPSDYCPPQIGRRRVWRRRSGKKKRRDVQGFDHGAGDAVQGRGVRRGRFRGFRRLADRRGHPRPGSGRYHGRKPDAESRRAQARRRGLHQDGGRPGAGDRRCRLQQHRRGDRSGGLRREGRGRRPARRHALLQQAEPGRSLSPFQGDQRRRRHSDRDLQHPAALDRRHERGDDGAALRVEEHRGCQGRDGQARPRQRPAGRDGTGFHPAFGRGRHRAGLHGPRRPRLHLGDEQRRAAALRPLPGSLHGRRLRRRAGDPGPAVPAAPGAVRRAEPPGAEVRAVAARQGPQRAAPAARSGDGAHRGDPPRGHGPRGPS